MRSRWTPPAETVTTLSLCGCGRCAVAERCSRCAVAVDARRHEPPTMVAGAFTFSATFRERRPRPARSATRTAVARRKVVVERSKPPSVRPGIRLSVHIRVRATLWCGLAPARIRRSIRSRRSRLGGLTPFPHGSVRTPHRSRRVVSFLFQRQRSPALDLRPVACPDGGGTFLARPAKGSGGRALSTDSR